MSILVTGGAGYIGSHTCVQLLQAGYEVVIADDFSNSEQTVMESISLLGGRPVHFYRCDLCKKDEVQKIFEKEAIEAVVHFAGKKAVGESVEQPLLYYNNNLKSTLNLLLVMEQFHVRKLVFSSSATVYGNPRTVPICEDAARSATNPYGYTKLIQERIMQDLQVADARWNFVLLRYFNPVGCHESGLLGENPKGIPNNLMPYIVRVAQGRLPYVNVFGNDYPTKDGTGVRDYIHVMDLADGHLAALKKMNESRGCHIYNLGTGKGYSVLEILRTCSEVNGVEIPYKVVGRRNGDVPACYADTTKAKKELGWMATRTLENMCDFF